MSSPLNDTVLPAERLLASGYKRFTGKSRSSNSSIMVWPTKPVAPSTATSNACDIMLYAPNIKITKPDLRESPVW